MRRNKAYMLCLVSIVGLIVVLTPTDHIYSISNATYLINKLLTQVQHSDWKFVTMPKLLDGTDGVLEAHLLKKPLWDVLEYDAQNFTSSNCKHKLIIAVHSATTHRANRDLLRTVYQRYLLSGIFEKIGSVKIFFIVGKDRSVDVQNQLRQESKVNKDMIFGTFTDHYFNMTLKNLFGKVKIHSQCKYEYLLKADDDVFINIPVILLNLFKMKPQQGLYMGYPCISGLISYEYIFKTRSFGERLQKFNFTPTDFPFPYAPKYSYGFAYLLSWDAVEAIVTEYRYIPYVRVIDDVFIAYILARSDISCCYSAQFVLEKDKYDDPCELNDILAWNFYLKTPQDFSYLKNVYNQAINTWTSCKNSFTHLAENVC